jgi:hypothetical protein
MATYYGAPMRPLKRSKINVKHKMSLKNQAHNNDYPAFVVGSVTNKVLQKLLLVDYMIKNSSWIRKELVERYKEYNRDNPELLVRKFGYSGTEGNLEPCELMHYLSPADIVKILGCNRRTAGEYKDALDSIHSRYESMCLCVSSGGGGSSTTSLGSIISAP